MLNKLLSVFALVLFASAANAACYTDSRYIPAGSPPPVFVPNFGAWCTANEGQNNGYNNGISPAALELLANLLGRGQQVAVNNGNAVNNGGVRYVNTGPQTITRPCTTGEQLARDAGGMLKGGVVGVLAGDDRKWAGVGAAIGIVTAEVSSCTVTEVIQPPAQQVVVNQQSAVATQNTPSVTSANWCVRAGKRYDCGGLLAVIRPNGEFACRPQAAPVEPGSQLCTGIQ